MKTFVMMLAAATFSFSVATAEAGGFGNNNAKSGGLINVSPSIGGISVGNGILAGSNILSGNTTSVLSGIGLGVLGTGLGLSSNQNGAFQTNLIGNYSLRKR